MTCPVFNGDFNSTGTYRKSSRNEQPSIAMFDYQVHTMILIGIGGNKPVHQMGYPAWGASELVFFKFGPSLLPSDVAQNHLCPATVSSRHFFIPF